MFSFLTAVAWYYVVATLFLLFSTVKDKIAGKEIDFEDVNLDLSIISIIYLIYYYLGWLS